MIYYLLDTTAVVLEYDPTDSYRVRKAKTFMKEMMEQGKKKDAFLFVPDFCVVEAFNTLARWRWRDKTLTEERYKESYRRLESAVKRRQQFYVYDLHRYHVLSCDEIFEAEHTTPLAPDKRRPGEYKGSLSSFDILIIAMGMELTKIHIDRSVYIVTCDYRLVQVNEKLRADRPGEFAEAKNPREDELPSELPEFRDWGRAKRS